MLHVYTKIKPQSILSSGEDFKVFLSYMGMAINLVIGPG